MCTFEYNQMRQDSSSSFLQVQSFFGQVDKVGLRILEALDLIPERVHLAHAVVADLGDRGRLIDAFTVLEDLLAQRTDGVVGNDALLPGVDRVEENIGRAGSMTSS